MAKPTSFILAAIIAAGAVSGAAAQDIGGRYRVEGTNFNGSPYRGEALIEVTSKNTCRIRWDTGSTSEGICMRNNNAFSAAYAFPNGKVGIVIYQIMADGHLEGLWTVADTDGVGTEVLTPLR